MMDKLLINTNEWDGSFSQVSTNENDRYDGSRCLFYGQKIVLRVSKVTMNC